VHGWQRRRPEASRCSDWPASPSLGPAPSRTGPVGTAARSTDATVALEAGSTADHVAHALLRAAAILAGFALGLGLGSVLGLDRA
jgi:hypothetical protein